MRFALALVIAVSTLAGCKKASTTTAPVTAAVSASGTWSGCLAGQGCSLTMILTDSATTDSTGVVKGTGTWLTLVTIKGTRLNSTVTLNADQAGQTLGWVFAGIVSGTAMSGNMSGPSIASSSQATFTRAP